jgi:hypothetical protein
MPLKDPEARRAYHRAYMIRWYEKNRELQKQRVYHSNAKRRALLTQRVNELKRRPCTDCGVRYPPFVMDFDHVSGEKLDDICTMQRRMMSWDTILAEVAKCDLVCSNCHRSRTYFRRMGQTPPRQLLSSTLGGDYVIVAIP